MRTLDVFLTLALTVVPLFAQPSSFTEETFHGRHAFVLDNGKIRVAALRGAGHIAELRLKSPDPKRNVNPMRIPHFPTIDPTEYDAVKHDPIYGGGTNRYLMAGYMGHLLNFPTFGGPSESEAVNGLGNHGEALTVRWEKQYAQADANGVTLVYGAYLPKTQYNTGRVLTVVPGETVLYIEEWAESLTAFDRPAHWVQHATFGPPFVEPGKTVLDMPGKKGEVRGRPDPANFLQPGPVEWPSGTSYEGKPVDLRPMQAKANAGTYYGVLMDPEREFSYFTMFHPAYNALIGYVWRTKDFPWVGDWQENHRNTGLPWNGKVVARGIEFGTTPFGGPMEQVVNEGSLYGVPVFRWMAGQKKTTARYLAFVTEIPDGFRGVEDVVVGKGQLTVKERDSGRVFPVAASRPWPQP